MKPFQEIQAISASKRSSWSARAKIAATLNLSEAYLQTRKRRPICSNHSNSQSPRSMRSNRSPAIGETEVDLSSAPGVASLKTAASPRGVPAFTSGAADLKSAHTSPSCATSASSQPDASSKSDKEERSHSIATPPQTKARPSSD